MHSPYRSRQQSLCTCCKANIGILPRVGLGTEPSNQASLAVYRSLDIVNIHGSSRSSAPSSFVQSAARQSLPENSKPAASLSRRYVTETLSFLPRCHFPFVPSATSKQGSRHREASASSSPIFWRSLSRPSWLTRNRTAAQFTRWCW